MKKYQLQVKNIIPETEESISIVFEQPKSEKISFKAGQFLTLLVDVGGKKERRAYSLCSCPYTETDLKINIKRVKDGKISNLLNNALQKGDIIEVFEPMGVFTPHLDAKNAIHYVLWAAGSGITPLLSMTKAILNQEPSSSISLIYANRNEESIIFKEELTKLQENNANRLKITHILSQNEGRLTADTARSLLSSIITTSKAENKPISQFMCGVAGMMDTVTEVSKTLNLDVPHKENFVATIEEAAKIAPEANNAVAEGSFMVKITYDGQEYEFPVKPDETILEAAIARDIDLPYSCQSGLCTACMGRCTSGKVKMTEDDCLTTQEIKDGWVLTCVTHPISDNVAITIE
jgi:ring-1,2-phenylacetyl-CoA epoxidase subunit PaaE